jgi:redox-sensitive bicupin YhaK (pirin superfamily)
MTAGGGIIHQEMPRRTEGRLRGFQLWVNLPAASKMMAPRYRDVSAATIPEVTIADGVRVKIIAGEVGGGRGPVGDVVVEPEYLDVTLGPGARLEHATPAGHTVFAYIVDGSGGFDPGGADELVGGQLALFGDGQLVCATAAGRGFRFLLVSGRPLHESVAWRGPIVMNSEQQLAEAFRQYHDGTFLAEPG